MQMIFKIIVAIYVIITTTGCLPALVGATATTGVVAAQERSAGDALDDATITAKIKSEFLQKDFDNLFVGTHVKTNEGRVLMTGTVPTAEARVEAVRIAWNQKGVKEVINEIKVAEKTGKLAIKDYSIDVWITTQLKSKFLLEKEIRSVNYNIETIEGVVYLLGIAQDQEELDRVIDIASHISRVKKVVSYVRLKDDPHRDKS